MGKKKYFIKLFGLLLAAFVFHFDGFMENTWSVN